MRSSTKLGAFIAVTATAVGLLTSSGAAGAADPTHPIIYLGAAGGSKVTALDGTVTSDLTALSVLQGITVPNSSHNDIAEAHVGDLLATGAITTSETASAAGSGAELVSHAKTLGVSLLKGLITVDAVETNGTSVFDGSTIDASTHTTFANIKIANVDLPVNIPHNFTVNIPNIAKVVLDYSVTYKTGEQVQTVGAGIFIQLLQPYAGSPLGTRIYLNPVYSALSAHVPHLPVLLGGSAYGSRLSVNGGDLIGINSGRTAFLTMSAGGTSGQTITNSTAGINIPHVLVGGAVQTTERGSKTNTTGDVLTTSRIAGVNLFDGLITADAIKATAHVHAYSDGHITINDTVSLLHLTIGGHAIPVTVSPNTRINVAGLGTVILNQQFGNSFDTNVRAIYIKLSTARAGLPVGAVIELAFVSGYVIT
jgi:hypothetical protein